MLDRLIVSKVKKELESLGIVDYKDLYLHKSDEEYEILKFRNREENFIIKYLENGGFEERIKKHLLLKVSGIKTFEVVKYNDRVVVIKDFLLNNEYKKVYENDLKNKKIVKIIAEMYKKLHSLKVSENEENILPNHNSFFTLENLKKIMLRFDLLNSHTMLYICSNFNNIKLKLDRLEKRFVYKASKVNYWCVDEKNESGIVIDLKDFGIGYAYEDFEKIMSLCDKEVFLKEYGQVNKDEMQIYRVFSIIMTLYKSILNDTFNIEVSNALRAVNEGTLLEDSKILVNWH